MTASGLVGRRITAITRLSEDEAKTEGWEQQIVTCIVLDDDTHLFPSGDEEGNFGGALFGRDSDGNAFRVMPED